MTTSDNLTFLSDDSCSISSSTNLNSLSTTTTPYNGSVTISSGTAYGWNNTISTDYIYREDSEYNKVPFARLMLTYLSNAQLDELMEGIKNKCQNDDEFQEAVKSIIQNRHCTEEFIMKYLDTSKLSKETLWVLLTKYHYSDISSGDYAQLAVLVQLTQ